MKIGLIDLDMEARINKGFPNLALMKLSAWHKAKGDLVEWYRPMFSGHLDRVYMSKVFSFTPEYGYYIDADEVIRGGSGYCIKLKDGKEVYDRRTDKPLPDEVDHIMPDYSLYGITDTAYGFMSRGCPRGCDFCIVKRKEGSRSRKVADLSEFWNGQKNIELLDPNTLACRDWEDILQQLENSGAYVNFNQGADIRLMNKKKMEAIKRIKIKTIHFAFDRYEDKEKVVPKLKEFREGTGWDRHKVTVYILCGYDTSIRQDEERIQIVRDIGFQPYVMLYDKEHIPKGHELRRLQRWVNSPQIFRSCRTFSEYR